MEWAQVKTLAADGVSQRGIAERLGINRRTVKRLLEAGEPPRYARSPAGSMLDPLEPVIRRLLEECPDMKAPRVTETLRETTATRARSIWSAGGWRRCARLGVSGRRSGRAIGRGR
jgi:transposase